MQAEAQPVNVIPKSTFITIGCAQFQVIVFSKIFFLLIEYVFCANFNF